MLHSLGLAEPSPTFHWGWCARLWDCIRQHLKSLCKAGAGAWGMSVWGEVYAIELQMAPAC